MTVEPENARAEQDVARFRDAVLGGDPTAIAARLDVGVRFFSPAFREPSVGRDTVAAVLTRARSIYQDLSFDETRAQREAGVLFFRAVVDDQPLQGCYRLRLSDEGTVIALDALVRPLAATQALVEAMMRDDAPPALA